MSTYLNKIIYWQGNLARIISSAEDPTVCIDMIEKPKCEKCGHPHNERFNVIPTSPYYKENAKPVETIE